MSMRSVPRTEAMRPPRPGPSEAMEEPHQDLAKVPHAWRGLSPQPMPHLDSHHIILDPALWRAPCPDEAWLLPLESPHRRPGAPAVGRHVWPTRPRAGKLQPRPLCHRISGQVQPPTRKLSSRPPAPHPGLGEQGCPHQGSEPSRLRKLLLLLTPGGVSAASWEQWP